MKLDSSSIIRQPALAEQLFDILTKSIKEGEYPPGELFPSEAELTKQLDVSRTVIREALARLKHDGFLEAQRGGRTKVARDPSGSVFRFDGNVGGKQEHLAFLYELRAVIEPEAAAMAAVRASQTHLAEIRRTFETMTRAIENGHDGTDESIAFHKAVINASGNPHMSSFVSWVDRKIWSFQQINEATVSLVSLTQAQEEHGALVEAIENHDPQTARRVARRHVISAAQRHNLTINLP